MQADCRRGRRIPSLSLPLLSFLYIRDRGRRRRLDFRRRRSLDIRPIREIIHAGPTPEAWKETSASWHRWGLTSTLASLGESMTPVLRKLPVAEKRRI